MKKYLALLGTMLFCMVCFFGCSGKSIVNGKYDVILPEGYEESTQNYPVIYVLPQDGYKKDDSGITELLEKSMEEGTLLDVIIVKPAFQEEDDAITALSDIIEEVNAEYRTINNKKFRVLMGTGTGGYLAYKAGLEERDLYGGMVSIRGDFASEENPWVEEYGSVGDVIDKMKSFSSAYFEEVYTYLDAPVDDAWTNMEGSTNDIGAMFIDMGTISSAHEFTARPGEFSEEFLEESVKRVSNRLTKFMLSTVFSGNATMENATLSEDEESGHVTYSLVVDNAYYNFTKDKFKVDIRVAVQEPVSGAVLTEAADMKEIIAKGTYSGDADVANIISDKSSDVVVYVRAFGGEMELAKTSMRRGQGNALDGDTQVIDLEGDWYFNYTGTKEKLDITTLKPDVYESWSVVQPGMGNWTKGYGNIDETTVYSTPEYFEYMITGNGYYVKTFEVPEEFDSTDITLSIGYVDDRMRSVFKWEICRLHRA